MGRKPIIEKSTLAPCIGTRRPIPPNRCDTCRKHSYITCDDVQLVVHGDGRVISVPVQRGEPHGGARDRGGRA